MIRKILEGVTLSAMVGLFVFGCDSKPAAPPPMVMQPPAPIAAPVAPQPPVAAPAVAPPATPLMPIVEETPEPATPRKGTGGGSDICKLSGPATDGKELLGNYKCKLKLKNPPLGLQPPASDCKVKAQGDGVAIAVASGEAARRSWRVKETKATGFHLSGVYEFSGQKLSIGACMKAQGPGKYTGSGSGALNGDRKNRLRYTLVMTRK